MSKYHITHSCGHSRTYNICGTDVHGERGRKTKWYASQPCPDCRRAEENAAAAQSNREKGLPQLEGSPKQIAWAETIRCAAVQAMDAFGSQLVDPAQIAGDSQRLATLSRIHALIAETKAITSAAWWIDHQADGFGQSWVCRKLDI